MKTIYLTYPHTLVKNELPETVTAIGFFDGIHKGHQKVIHSAVAIAKEKGLESAVMTFHPHPSVVLSKGKKQVNYITPVQDKQNILQGMNVDRLYIIKFDEQLAALSSQDFIDQFIIGLNIKHVVAGFDYTYGHKGSGNMKTMPKQSHGKFTTTVIDKIQMANEKVSSTKIRECLKQGDITQANLLLQRPLRTRGLIIEGAKRGRQLGFPTANLMINEETLLPKPGIYAAKVIIKGEQYEGMVSLGTNPTFTGEGSDLSLEVNILDYNNILYGEELEIEWYQFIRDEEKFTSADALIKQMKDDENKIRNFFRLKEL